jgi:hypothetical protein
MYPYGSGKEIKVYPVAFSCIYEHEKEQRLSSVCPQLESWWLSSRMIIKGWRHAPPSFNSFTDFEVVTNFCARWRKRIQVDEMKVKNET